MKLTAEQNARMVALMNELPFEVVREVVAKVYKEGAGR